MKKILLLQILILLTSQFAWAFDLDMTVDDDIRKNYNSSKLVKDTHTEANEETLPALPEISKYKESEQAVIKQETYTPPTQIYNKGNKSKVSKKEKVEARTRKFTKEKNGIN